MYWGHYRTRAWSTKDRFGTTARHAPVGFDVLLELNYSLTPFSIVQRSLTPIEMAVRDCLHA
jgi:hypothetical protein